MPLLLTVVVVTIRIYNYAAVSPAQVEAARAAATEIFQNAGIPLRWTECSVPDSLRAPSAFTGKSGIPVAPIASVARAPAATLCTNPLGEHEFVLRLIDTIVEAGGGDAGPRMLALGSALVPFGAGSGVLITVDSLRAVSVAVEAGVDPSLVLGRAIAHEIGHLLLASSKHADKGLMRALWTQQQLRENRSADWQFSAREAQSMQERLAGATHAAN